MQWVAYFVKSGKVLVPNLSEAETDEFIVKRQTFLFLALFRPK